MNEEIFWVGDTLVQIDNEIIHKVIGLFNEGCNPMNEKNVKKFFEENMKIKSDGSISRIWQIND